MKWCLRVSGHVEASGRKLCRCPMPVAQSGGPFLSLICSFHSELLVMQEKETVASHCLPLMAYLLPVADWTPKNHNPEKQSTEAWSARGAGMEDQGVQTLSCPDWLHSLLCAPTASVYLIYFCLWLFIHFWCPRLLLAQSFCHWSLPPDPPSFCFESHFISNIGAGESLPALLPFPVLKSLLALSCFILSKALLKLCDWQTLQSGTHPVSLRGPSFIVLHWAQASRYQDFKKTSLTCPVRSQIENHVHCGFLTPV